MLFLAAFGTERSSLPRSGAGVRSVKRGRRGSKLGIHVPSPGRGAAGAQGFWKKAFLPSVFIDGDLVSPVRQYLYLYIHLGAAALSLNSVALCVGCFVSAGKQAVLQLTSGHRNKNLPWKSNWGRGVGQSLRSWMLLAFPNHSLIRGTMTVNREQGLQRGHAGVTQAGLAGHRGKWDQAERGPGRKGTRSNGPIRVLYYPNRGQDGRTESRAVRWPSRGGLSNKSLVATHIRHAKYVLPGHCTGTGTVHSYYGKSLRFLLTAFVLDHVQRCATNSVYAETWKSQTDTANPQNPLGKHVQREKENLGKCRCLSVLIRSAEGWRKRAKWRDGVEKHTGLFWEQVVESPALCFKKY